MIVGNEQCDDGNIGCLNDCSGPKSGWDCSSLTVCSTICGDGLWRGSEVCDDGVLDNEGCADDCLSILTDY